MSLFVRSDVQNLWGVPTFLGVLILHCEKERNMCTCWHICKTLSTYEKLHVQKFCYKFLFFKKLIIQGSIEIVTYRRLKYWVFVFPGPWPRFVFWQPKSQFVYRGPVPKFVFTSSGPQSVFVSPQPSICIYWPWLIRIRIIKVKGCI